MHDLFPQRMLWEETGVDPDSAGVQGEERVTYDLLVNLFYMPLQHLHGYNRLLLKLATALKW